MRLQSVRETQQGDSYILVVQSNAYGRYFFQASNGIYYFRLVVPRSLRKLYPHLPTEIRRSLRTSNRCEARWKALELFVRYSMELSLTESEIHNINDFFDFLNSKLLFDGSLPAELQDKLTVYLNDLKLRIAKDTGMLSIAQASTVAKDKLIALKDLVEATEDPYLACDYPKGDKILRDIVNTTHELLIRLKSLQGESLADILEETKQTSLPPPNKVETSEDYFTTVCKEFINERLAGNNWDIKTCNAYKTTFTLFEELIGNLPVSTINGAIYRTFKSQVLLIPRNHSKILVYRDKTLKQLVELKVPEEQRISVESANKHIGKMSSLLSWCKNQGYTSENPFSGSQIRINKSKIDNRQPFSIEDLNKLFDDPIYRSGKMRHSYYFWLPLIGLYSGARIQEICQLELSDIHEVDSILVFDINGSAPTKRLKTPSSKRLIPVHHDLIAIGFDRLLQRRKRAKDKQLFPELHKNASSREGQSQPASKWFGRYKTKHGFSLDGLKAFHSFRHTFIDELKYKNTPEHITAALAGHSHENITYGTYGGKTSIELLNEHLQKIEYKGFNRDLIKWIPK